MILSSFITHLRTNTTTEYKLGVALSSLSVVLGLIREILIVAILGFSKNNDILQIYLSVFYTIGLVFDPLRLSCLNLCGNATLTRILLCASITAIPYAIIIGVLLTVLADHIHYYSVAIAALGGYLNVIMAMMVTYKQRFGLYLPAVIINVLSNVIILPGIIIIHLSHTLDFINTLLCLLTVVPIIQLILLFQLKLPESERVDVNENTFAKDLVVFLRHGVAIIGEQLYQVISRAAFLHAGAGLLTLYSLAIKVYSTSRYILVDNYIAVKLKDWKTSSGPSMKLMNNSVLTIILMSVSLLIITKPSSVLFWYATQLIMLLVVSFYFSSQLRILYFKINRDKYAPSLINRYALLEIGFASMLYFIWRVYSISSLQLVWCWYIVRSIIQFHLLKRMEKDGTRL